MEVYQKMCNGIHIKKNLQADKKTLLWKIAAI